MGRLGKFSSELAGPVFFLSPEPTCPLVPPPLFSRRYARGPLGGNGLFPPRGPSPPAPSFMTALQLPSLFSGGYFFPRQVSTLFSDFRKTVGLFSQTAGIHPLFEVIRWLSFCPPPHPLFEGVSFSQAEARRSPRARYGSFPWALHFFFRSRRQSSFRGSRVVPLPQLYSSPHSPRCR